VPAKLCLLRYGNDQADADGTFCSDLALSVWAGMAGKEPIVVDRSLTEVGRNS
jgi:hypothetical protein